MGVFFTNNIVCGVVNTYRPALTCVVYILMQCIRQSVNPLQSRSVTVAQACIRTTSAVDEDPKMTFLCDTRRNRRGLNVFVAFRVSVDLLTYCYGGN
jgi:hypothetical protein